MKLHIGNVHIEDKYLTVANDKVAARTRYYTKRGWALVSTRAAGSGQTMLQFRKSSTPEVTITP